MISLGLLVLIVVLLVAYVSTRHPVHAGAVHAGAVHAGGPLAARGDALDRWVEAGLISGEQASAIAAFEQAQRAARPVPRVSPWVEALAYVGGVLLAVGAAMLVSQFWDDLGVAGRLGILSAAAVVTGVAGAVVGEADPVTWRLRGFVWALSAAAIAAVAGLFVLDVVDASGEPVALSAAGVGALASGAYWWLRDRPLQHALAFVGLAASLGVAIAWVGGDATVGGLIGLALWLLGGAWVALAWYRRIPPRAVGFLLGAVLTLVASAIVSSQFEWLAPLLGLATAGGWVVMGATRGVPQALVPGVAGVFTFLPWALGYFFGDALGAPAIAMLSGVLLLGVVVVLVRRGRGTGSDTGGHVPPVAHV